MGFFKNLVSQNDNEKAERKLWFASLLQSERIYLHKIPNLSFFFSDNSKP